MRCVSRGRPREPWDPVDAAGTPLAADADAGVEGPDPRIGLRPDQVRAGAADPDTRPVYGMEGVALRLWNVYGPGQALSNPYTGVLAIFASRLHNGQPPMIFEDGEQRRDFVHVEDVAEAFVLALEHPQAPGNVFNMGSGQDWSVEEVARILAGAMGRPHLEPEITAQARTGDIRHCIADIGKARARARLRAAARLRRGRARSWPTGSPSNRP